MFKCQKKMIKKKDIKKFIFINYSMQKNKMQKSKKILNFI